MLRRTKIIATLGPATDDDTAIEKLIRAGIDLVRINFSHGQPADHYKRVRSIRKWAATLGRSSKRLDSKPFSPGTKNNLSGYARNSQKVCEEPAMIAAALA